jgi:hypothetical protein
MNAGRHLLGLFFAVGAILALLNSFGQIDDLFTSAGDFGMHHEVTVPLCRFLALAALAIGLALAAAHTHAGDRAAVCAALGGFGLVAIVGWAAAQVFVNEVFYSLLDPKGFPVHLTEPVLFPGAGWHGMTSHILAALLLTFGFGFVWFALRRRPINDGIDTSR